MPRIRSLHPGQWTDEAFVSCTMEARLLALGLRNIADDNGVFAWKPLTIKMQLFPADAVDVAAMLAELVRSEQVARFEVGGATYGVIRNFRKWQRPEKPKALHPIPDEWRAFAGLSENDGGTTSDTSPTGRRPVADTSAKVSAEEGGRREEDTSSLRSDGAPAPPPPAGPPPDARGELFGAGLARTRRLTGKSDGQCRAMLGRWLRDLGDDCTGLSRVLFEAEDARPADPVAWIEAAVRSRRGERPPPQASPVRRGNGLAEARRRRLEREGVGLFQGDDARSVVAEVVA
jgi:hypothetical protein